MTLIRQAGLTEKTINITSGFNRARKLIKYKKSLGNKQSNIVSERVKFFSDYELVPVFTKGSQKYIDSMRIKPAKTTLTYKQLAEVLEKGREESPPYTRKMVARPFISAFRELKIPAPVSFGNPNATLGEIISDIEAEANERFIKIMSENGFGLAPRKAWMGTIASGAPLYRTGDLVHSITWKLVKKQ